MSAFAGRPPLLRSMLIASLSLAECKDKFLMHLVAPHPVGVRYSKITSYILICFYAPQAL